MRASQSRSCRPVFAVVAAGAWVALLLQFALMVSAVGTVQALLICVSFFSIVSNLLVALAATAIAVRPGGGFARSTMPGAVAVYVTIVAVIWLSLLRGTYTVTGLGLFADAMMHEILPPLYVLAWLLCLPKRGLRFRDAAMWLILPLCYAAWMFARGAIDGWYPYPFINVTSIGYPRAAIVTVVFILIFWIVGCAYVGIDRLLANRSQATVTAASSD